MLRALKSALGLLVCCAMFFGQAVNGAYAENKGVTGNILINAAPEKVWGILSTTGHFDDKLQSVNGDEAIVEQKFSTLPLMGSETIVVKAKVKNMERIDFTMVKADHVKGFNGSWSITPMDSQSTRLHLRMDVDTGLPIPQFLVNKFISGKVKNRLKKVKALAEKPVLKQAQETHDGPK